MITSCRTNSSLFLLQRDTGKLRVLDTSSYVTFGELKVGRSRAYPI